MKIRPLKLREIYEIIPEPKQDDRGYFIRVYDEAIFSDLGLQT